MHIVPLLCEAGYGNLGDDLAVSLIRELFFELFEYDFDLRAITMSQAHVGHMPPYEKLALIGPGTLLAPNDKAWNQMLALQVDRGWDFGCVGTGVAGIKDFGHSAQGAWLLGRILHMSPLLWVRGTDSMNVINRSIDKYCTAETYERFVEPVRVIGDPVSLFYKTRFKRAPDDTVLVNFGYTAYCQAGWGEMMEDIVSVCDLLKSEGDNPVAWPIWARHDDWPLQKVCYRSKIEVTEPTSTARGHERLLTNAKATICFRLHAGLFSLACGVPAVMIAYQRKIHDACKDLGWPYVIDPGTKNFSQRANEMMREAIADTSAMGKVKAKAAVMAKKVRAGVQKAMEEYR